MSATKSAVRSSYHIQPKLSTLVIFISRATTHYRAHALNSGDNGVCGRLVAYVHPLAVISTEF
jgi:hypothetical protein